MNNDETITIHKLIHVEPFVGWEVIDESTDRDAIDKLKADLLEKSPTAWLMVAEIKMPKPAEDNRQ